MTGSKIKSAIERAERNLPNWRRYEGVPEDRWPFDALDARLAERVLGRPIASINAMGDADLTEAIERVCALITEGKRNEKRLSGST